MAYFALVWKARAIEKYRINYEKEKIKSILQQNPEIPRETVYEKWSHCKYNTKKRLTKTLRRCFPEGSKFLNFVIYLRTDQTFPNFVWKSVLGFVGGIVLTYLCFMFFVFQLAISLIHATIMSSIIGVLLTLGLAFSYRARCLVFLLIPQFFSRVGRYTLTCYALVLILTGPATNTLKNSEVLSESMACSQEQLKTSVKQISESAEKPFNSMKDTIKVMIDRIRQIAETMKEPFLKIHTLGMHIVSVFKNSLSWLNSIVDICNKKLGTPYERCNKAIEEGIKECKAKSGASLDWSCHSAQIGHGLCESFKPLKFVCAGVDYLKGPVIDTIKRKLQNYSEHISAMLFLSIHVHHSYSFSSNSSRSASQVAAGIVTEIRAKADPMLTWISWSSCVTSAFLLLIIFRAKHYQCMFETRSRFDNRYVTKELRDLDLKRVRQGRETVLPLNVRERAKYVTTTSFRLVASEKLYLTRSAVFTAITTFKLLIHMVADYSLYWVLITIRYHGRFQSPLKPETADKVVKVLGQGAVANILREIIAALSVPLNNPMSDPITCLPDPYPPDFQRYAQIGVLILLLWFFALLEPYGLRMRHIIMSLYSPARAKARAGWLYNHILRTRGSFLKYARRKLHRVYKYSGDEKLTFRYWVDTHIPFSSLRYLLGNGQRYSQCVLCGVTNQEDPKSDLTRCETPNCPGMYCPICFSDIGQLCTVCLSPVDYGDLSDVSLEKGSSESSNDDSDDDSMNDTLMRNNNQGASPSTLEADDSDSSPQKYVNRTRSTWFSTKNKQRSQEEVELLAYHQKSKMNKQSTPDMLQHELKNVIKKSLTQNKNPTVIKNIPGHTYHKNNKKVSSYKICNNPMIYTALVSYDNPTEHTRKGYCENRAKIKEALDDLSARKHHGNVCAHSSLWIKYNTRRRNAQPRKRNINLSSLQLKKSRKFRNPPTRDLTAFMSTFYHIQRKGMRFSIAKLYSTSKIGKILRRKFRVIRRRRVKNKSARVFSKSNSCSRVRNNKNNSHDCQIQEDSHELTEIVVTNPSNNTDQKITHKPNNSRGSNERKDDHLRDKHCFPKRYTRGTDLTTSHDKARGVFSQYFNTNFINPVATLFSQTNNIPPVLENKTNYKRRKKDDKNLTAFFRSKRKSGSKSRLSTFLHDSERMKNINDESMMTPENSDHIFEGSVDKLNTDSTSLISKKSSSHNKHLSFKQSILSVKKYCSNIAQGRKNNKKKFLEEREILTKPLIKSTTTRYEEVKRLLSTKEETCSSDPEVGVTKETCSCGVQYTRPEPTSYTETTSYTGTKLNSSTETLTPPSENSRDTVKYECEDSPSADFTASLLKKKNKSASIQLDSKSTATDSTVTANATTVINDWWSPILEERKKVLKRRTVEKNTSGDCPRVTSRRKSRNIAKSNLKSSLASTDTKLVSFRSKADIIPSGPLYVKGLTPSRYLTQQKPYRSVLKKLHYQKCKHIYCFDFQSLNLISKIRKCFKNKAGHINVFTRYGSHTIARNSAGFGV